MKLEFKLYLLTIWQLLKAVAIIVACIAVLALVSQAFILNIRAGCDCG